MATLNPYTYLTSDAAASTTTFVQQRGALRKTSIDSYRLTFTTGFSIVSGGTLKNFKLVFIKLSQKII
jgi:hypothetical protein